MNEGQREPHPGSPPPAPPAGSGEIEPHGGDPPITDPNPPQKPPSPAARAALLLIRGYKAGVSPLMPPACRFVPTCSEYGYEAIAKYGIIRGGRLALWRLLRCNPFGGSGYDPVP